MTKICPYCKIEKEDQEFGMRTQKNGKQTIQSYCRKCRGGLHKGSSLKYLTGEKEIISEDKNELV